MTASLNPSLGSYHKKSEKVRASSSGVSAQVIYIVPSAQTSAFESAFAINSAHPVYSSSKLLDREMEQYGGDDGADVLYTYRLTYGVPTASGTLGVRPAGSENRRGSANAVDVPITQHPSYVATWADTKPGVDSYLSPQPTYTHTEIFDSAFFVFDESEIIKNVGKRAAMSHLNDAGLDNVDSANNWLLISRDVVENGNVVEVTRTWQYAENGWDTDIYSAPEA